MSKVFRPSSREAKLLSKIESTKERSRRKAIMGINECVQPLSNAVAMKLVEEGFVETTSKNSLEEEIAKTLEELTRSEDFDIDYSVAPYRNIVPHPHIVSLSLTAFVIEKLINYRDIIDIYGSDEEIYHCINRETVKYLPVE